jgi:lon-related putative ATP-dependent protease
MTDFNLIKPGALHAANGGYLILDARKLLSQPFAWDELKRTLQAREICIRSLGDALGIGATVTLEPEPIPLDIKVILLGDPLLYYLLSQLDPDFPELFKVTVDFDDRVDRTPHTDRLFARMLATMVRREGLSPFDAGAVSQVIEQAARLAADGEKLSLHMRPIVDLLREAAYWAQAAARRVVTADDVRQAIGAHIHRLDRIRARTQEEIVRGTILIDTAGAVVGQVNGIAVLQVGDLAFGKPSRITARVRLGRGEVVDIEREVALGGPIHSKGVLILAGFLGQRFGRDRPLALSASLVFEQSYGGVEGDSASSTELYALLSAVSGIPVRQCLAVTGAVNQQGAVQAVGGINEKIEGFFDLCSARGLTGEQGVLIPHSNVKHLMLREDVVAAVEARRFHIYPVETVDQGIAILTGRPAGDADAAGRFPEGTVNHAVQEQLQRFAEQARSFASSGAGGAGGTVPGGGGDRP